MPQFKMDCVKASNNDFCHYKQLFKQSKYTKPAQFIEFVIAITIT